MVMAISYFLVAWQTTTHRSQQSQDLNVHAEPACPSFQHISGHQHDVNPGGLVQTTLGDMPLENRSCSKLLRLPLARVWIMLSLVALTLVASVLQGLRIRRGIDCEVYGKLVEDYCRTTKTAVTTSLLASLLWLVWFTFWFLTSYCIGIGSNSGVIDDDATRRGTMMGSDDEIEEKENQDESPGVFGITTQISQGSGLQRRQDSGMGHTRISQLDRKEDVPFLSHQYQQRLPFVEDVMAQAALNTSRNGLDSNAFSEKDAEGLFISEADLFSISLDDEKEDVGDEGTTSSEQYYFEVVRPPKTDSRCATFGQIA
ncbi:hypothetical protein EDD11_007509 [Mortierella claussenii]|nr:hypothetical protein EDD11_007509 [Mortierella claussenii]